MKNEKKRIKKYKQKKKRNKKDEKNLFHMMNTKYLTFFFSSTV